MKDYTEELKMKDYVVVYLVGGIHYRFRCTENTKRDARRACHNAMSVKYSDITDCYEEFPYHG